MNEEKKEGREGKKKEGAKEWRNECSRKVISLCDKINNEPSKLIYLSKGITIKSLIVIQ